MKNVTCDSDCKECIFACHMDHENDDDEDTKESDQVERPIVDCGENR